MPQLWSSFLDQVLILENDWLFEVAFLDPPSFLTLETQTSGFSRVQWERRWALESDDLCSVTGSPIHQSTIPGLTSPSIGFPNYTMGILIVPVLKAIVRIEQHSEWKVPVGCLVPSTYTVKMSHCHPHHCYCQFSMEGSHPRHSANFEPIFAEPGQSPLLFALSCRGKQSSSSSLTQFPFQREQSRAQRTQVTCSGSHSSSGQSGNKMPNLELFTRPPLILHTRNQELKITKSTETFAWLPSIYGVPATWFISLLQ